jgi:hypothetical protein
MRIKNEPDFLEIIVLGRSNPKSEDYWDANWLDIEIKLQVSSFNCKYHTNLRVDELLKFYEDLLALKNRQNKDAVLNTMEEGIYLHLESDVNGKINLQGKAKDQARNILDFKFQTVMISFDDFIVECEKVIAMYPLIGNVKQ